MQMIHPSRLLVTGLAIDSACTAVLALVQLAYSGPLSSLAALPSALVMRTGVFMLTYALALAVLARANAVAKALVQLIAWGNLGWAALALALPMTGVLLPSAAGWLLLGAHVAGTALFAGLQLVGLRQSRTADPGRSTQLKA